MTDNTKELDDMPDLSDTHTIVDVPGFGKVWVVNDIYGYYNTWLDWHNKRIEAALDRLDSQREEYFDGVFTIEIIKRSVIDAERNRLKEGK